MSLAGHAALNRLPSGASARARHRRDRAVCCGASIRKRALPTTLMSSYRKNTARINDWISICFTSGLTKGVMEHLMLWYQFLPAALKSASNIFFICRAWLSTGCHDVEGLSFPPEVSRLARSKAAASLPELSARIIHARSDRKYSNGVLVPLCLLLGVGMYVTIAFDFFVGISPGP